MIVSFAEQEREDYLYRQTTDKKALRRIKDIIKEISRTPFEGKGDREPLRHNWSGYWSRRIDREHRIVYKVLDDEIVVVQCRYHR